MKALAHEFKKPDISDVTGITAKLKKETEVEHIYLIKHNKAIAWFEGNKYCVIVPDEQLLRFKDGLVLHNHPNSTSFSFDDINGVVANNVKEMRLFSPKYTFVVKRPNQGWTISFHNPDVIETYNEIVRQVEEGLEQAFSRGKMTSKEKEEMINHLVWQRFFDKFDIYYNVY